MTPGANVIKHFLSTDFYAKLECLLEKTKKAYQSQTL